MYPVVDIIFVFFFIFSNNIFIVSALVGKLFLVLFSENLYFDFKVLFLIKQAIGIFFFF